jgi:hypothetical protein
LLAELQGNRKLMNDQWRIFPCSRATKIIAAMLKSL